MSSGCLTRRIAAAVLLAAVLACTACKAKPTPTASVVPPERPQVTQAPDKIQPPDAARFTGYTLRVIPARGPEIILQEPIGAQLIMDAFASQRLQVPDAMGKFQNKLEVLDGEGQTRYTFSLASDGQLIAKSDDGRAFRMPEYIYYHLEEQLWNYEGSLMDGGLKWQPDKGTAALELELPRLIKAAMLPAFGYASAYFCTYTIYGMNTATRDVAKIYMLMTYAGYDIDGAYFSANFLHTTPATLIFKKDGGVWRLTDLKQPLPAKEKKHIYNNVREIFPYEHMETVLEDLKDTSPQVKDIMRQATEHLNDVGITGLTVYK